MFQVARQLELQNAGLLEPSEDDAGGGDNGDSGHGRADRIEMKDSTSAAWIQGKYGLRAAKPLEEWVVDDVCALAHALDLDVDRFKKLALDGRDILGLELSDLERELKLDKAEQKLLMKVRRELCRPPELSLGTGEFVSFRVERTPHAWTCKGEAAGMGGGTAESADAVFMDPAHGHDIFVRPQSALRELVGVAQRVLRVRMAKRRRAQSKCAELPGTTDTGGEAAARADIEAMAKGPIVRCFSRIIVNSTDPLLYVNGALWGQTAKAGCVAVDPTAPVPSSTLHFSEVGGQIGVKFKRLVNIPHKTLSYVDPLRAAKRPTKKGWRHVTDVTVLSEEETLAAPGDDGKIKDDRFKFSLHFQEKNRLPSDPYQGCIYYRVAIMAVIGYTSALGQFVALPCGDTRSGVSSRFVTVSSAFRVADKKAYDKAERASKKQQRLKMNTKRKK